MKTAEEFLIEKRKEVFDATDLDLPKLMIEFTKMHMKEALKQAAEKAKMYKDVEAIDRDSILRAYSLKNII